MPAMPVLSVAVSSMAVLMVPVMAMAVVTGLAKTVMPRASVSTIPASSVLATMMMTGVPMISERTHIMMAVTVAMTGTVSGMTVAVATMMTNMPMFSMPPAGMVMSMMLAAVAMVAELAAMA